MKEKFIISSLPKGWGTLPEDQSICFLQETGEFAKGCKRAKQFNSEDEAKQHLKGIAQAHKERGFEGLYAITKVLGSAT